MKPTLMLVPPLPSSPWRGTTAIVAVDTGTCPTCTAATVDETVRTDALFMHGGYGATTRRHCTVCVWSQVVDRSEERPPR